jgi:type III pantothenate kinase
MDPRLREGVRRYLGQTAFFVEPGIRTDMPLLVDAPNELGADRLCDAVAAFAEHGGPCLVLDFGTAVTWEVVSAAGEYLGGAIAPGPAVTAEALSSKTAKLPRVALAPPPRVIGKGTVDSIQSGMFYGYLGLIEGVTRRVLEELGEATVVATGGLASAFAEHTDLIHHVEPDLTLHGLRLLWRLNRGESR